VRRNCGAFATILSEEIMSEELKTYEITTTVLVTATSEREARAIAYRRLLTPAEPNEPNAEPYVSQANLDGLFEPEPKANLRGLFEDWDEPYAN
jgi:hypothetical protein